jgi:hypothetical protein
MLVGALAVLTGCHGNDATQRVSFPAAPAPGHGSPRAAAAGFLHGITSDDPSSSCNYVEPDIQGNCLSGIGDIEPATGTWSVGKAVIKHRSAIVVALFSKFCVEDKCRTNTNPRAGLPSRGDFDTAYGTAQGASHHDCVRTRAREVVPGDRHWLQHPEPILTS